jgi:hypothetical protein
MQAWLDFICPLREYQDFYRGTAERSLAAVYPVIVAAARADERARIADEFEAHANAAHDLGMTRAAYGYAAAAEIVRQGGAG